VCTAGRGSRFHPFAKECVHTTTGLESGSGVNMEHELHGARFSKLQKIQNLNFEKIQKKYQSVVYDLFYQCVKFYYKISYILSSAKITKI
jgi:hypothetical protein